MKSLFKKSNAIHWVFILALFCIQLEAFTQENIGRQTISQFDADHHVLKPDAHPLKQSVPMARGQSNAAFLSGVGGVSFDQVATPGKGLKVHSLTMEYNKEKSDGYRLDLQINGKQLEVVLADWMLIPIAKYAESSDYSCITIFGKLRDEELQKQVTEHEGRVINYHPAFDNTLLGVRLVYMDMLVGYSFTSDLARNSNGQYILGAGEVAPNTDANKKGAYDLSQHMISVGNKHMEQFRSYVISDFTREIVFDAINGTLILSGNPYYYCWKYNKDRPEYDINKVAKDLSSAYNKEIEHLQKTEGRPAVQSWLIEKLIVLSDKYKDNYSLYQRGTFIDLVNLPSHKEKRSFLENYKLESLFSVIIDTEAYMDADSIIYLKKYSNDISSRPGLFNATNPAVWKATVSTMRYAAFFRFVKINFPETWHAFLKQVTLLNPKPWVETPTIMYDPESKAIEQAINTSKKR